MQLLEQEIEIDTRDNKKILCLLNRNKTGVAENLVVMVHGLAGNPYEFPHMEAARFFTAHGYDVVRFSLYGATKRQRKLVDCTVMTQAEDTGAVIGHFGKGYRNVFAIGHSYGGMTLLRANPAITAMSFWDSTLDPYNSFWKHEAEWVESLGCYKIRCSVDILIGQAMVETDKVCDLEGAAGMAMELHAPVQYIRSGIGSESGDVDAFIKALPEPKEVVKLPDADHGFTKPGTALQALEQSRNWFETRKSKKTKALW